MATVTKTETGWTVVLEDGFTVTYRASVVGARCSKRILVSSARYTRAMQARRAVSS